MDVYSYKCPNCGASLKYNPGSPNITCDYCSSKFTLEEIDKYLKSNPDRIVEEEKTRTETKPLGEKKRLNKEQRQEQLEELDDHIMGYTCQNCGAEVVTDDTTLTTFCYYCHSPVVIVDRTSGDFRPDYLIPFKIDRDKAEKTFLSWAGSNRYVPKSFYSESQLEKITGIYLPYWGLDVKLDVDIRGRGSKQRVYRRGNNEYVDSSHYKVQRQGIIEINNITELAYKKVDHFLLDAITPYRMEDLEPFKVFYLNGFFSETYDMPLEEVKPKLERRLGFYKNALVVNAFNDYDSYKIENEDLNTLDETYSYTLLPTWMMTYDYNDKKYIYAINGQTGKAYGELPINKNRIRLDAAIAALVVFILVLLGGYFLW